ncbi:MAG: amidohydrolase family protein [Carboxydocellales bacterium]
MARAIDYMNYPFTPKLSKQYTDNLEGELICNMQASLKDGWPSYTPEKMIQMMDEANVEKVFICACKMYSYWNHKFLMDYKPEDIYKIIQQYPGRFVGMAGYNPFRIMESLHEIETAVKEYGFKGVYIHIYGFDMPLNDQRMYPLYAKCSELGIPVSMQVGYVLEAMPSKHAQPIYLDEIALHFPDLKIIGSHTGYPYCEELISIAYKWDNIYFGVDAHMPKYLEPNVVKFINSRGQDKVIWGSNGLSFKTMLEQIDALGLKEQVKQKLLRDNAIKIFNLDV